MRGLAAALVPTAGSLTLASGYSPDFADIEQLTITPRPITVTADNQTRPFDQPNPPLTFMATAGNLVNGDALPGGLATTALGQSRGRVLDHPRHARRNLEL